MNEKLAQIKTLLKDYENLTYEAKRVALVIEDFDPELYNTFNGIEEVGFEEDIVWVRCDNSCRGSYDSESYTFPLNYLVMTNDELEVVCNKVHKERVEKKKEEKIKKQKEETEAKEKRELETYHKLKEKFEK